MEPACTSLLEERANAVSPLEAEQCSRTPGRGPLFVIGMWRSGTSLLYALLNQHPQIALMYEADLHLLQPLFWIPGTRRRWVDRWEFWNHGLGRHGLERNQTLEEVRSLRAAARTAYSEYAEKKGAIIGGEKSPNYFDCLTQLADDFPDARFIVIWRDPASVCRSVLQAASQTHSWFDRRGISLRVLIGLEKMREECDQLISRGVPVFEVRFPVLINSPEETMKGICRFLGIPFVPAMASLAGADRSAIYEGRHHALVNGEKIVASSKRAGALPKRLGSKINRYIALWHEIDSRRWPEPSPRSAKPSPMERAWDRFCYRCLRALDSMVVFIYCSAPLRLLGTFRDIKHRRAEARAQKKRSTAASPVSSDISL
jgi:Sulfotransferase family